MSKYSRVLQTGQNQITQKYNKLTHKAVDLVKYKGQTDTIIAHSEGTVVWIQTGQKNNKTAVGNKSYGNCVKLKHNDGYYTLYAHLSEVYVKLGEKVKKGQPIGYMGNTGRSFGAHLHFEVRNTKDQKINPTDYLNKDLPSTKVIYYRTHHHGKWQGTKINGEQSGDGKGWISAYQIKSNVGTVYYKSHLLGGKWLAEVKKWDDTANGYAGIYGKKSDAIMVKTSVPIMYRVKTKKHGWLNWVSGYDTKDANNGYAGIMNDEITALEIKFK